MYTVGIAAGRIMYDTSPAYVCVRAYIFLNLNLVYMYI
jgi:hypothetical protein